jgi:hypothetical protein
MKRGLSQKEVVFVDTIDLGHDQYELSNSIRRHVKFFSMPHNISYSLNEAESYIFQNSNSVGAVVVEPFNFVQNNNMNHLLKFLDFVSHQGPKIAIYTPHSEKKYQQKGGLELYETHHAEILEKSIPVIKDTLDFLLDNQVLFVESSKFDYFNLSKLLGISGTVVSGDNYLYKLKSASRLLKEDNSYSALVVNPFYYINPHPAEGNYVNQLKQFLDESKQLGVEVIVLSSTCDCMDQLKQNGLVLGKTHDFEVPKDDDYIHNLKNAVK